MKSSNSVKNAKISYNNKRNWCNLEYHHKIDRRSRSIHKGIYARFVAMVRARAETVLNICRRKFSKDPIVVIRLRSRNGRYRQVSTVHRLLFLITNGETWAEPASIHSNSAKGPTITIALKGKTLPCKTPPGRVMVDKSIWLSHMLTVFLQIMTSWWRCKVI